MMSSNAWENALLSYDRDLITQTARKLHVTLPEDNRAFWIIVAMAIIRMNKATPFDRETAHNILREVGYES